MKEKKILFIWPPFVWSTWVPLGIPALCAYLKNKGAENIEALDMNAVYLKQTQGSLCSLYRAMKMGSDICKRRIKEFHGRTDANETFGKKEDFSESLIWKFYDYLQRGKLKIVGLINAGSHFIPWSLKSILASFSENSFADLRRKIKQLLSPVMGHDNLSFVCISANYPEQLFFALLIAQELKAQFGPAVKIAIGGAQVTKHIEQLFRSREIFGVVDFLVVGDGEEPLLQLLTTHNDFSDIPNLYYRDPNVPDEYVKSKKTFALAPDDFLVPDFTGFDFKDYIDFIPLILVKGCYWSRCSFCSFSSMQARQFCAGSAEKAVSVIQGAINKYGITKFFFVDDALPPKFMKDLACCLLANKVDISWSSFMIVDRAFKDRSLCQLLRKSGFDLAMIGLESISSRVLHLMNKYHQNMDESEIKEVLAALKSADIEVQLNIIFGFPSETLDEARNTLKFLTDNTAIYDYVAMQPFCLEDHTVLSDNPQQFGIQNIYKEDKNAGQRLGYAYEVNEGMSQAQAIQFTYQIAQKIMAEALKGKTRLRRNNF